MLGVGAQPGSLSSSETTTICLYISPHQYGLTSYIAHADTGTTGYHSAERHLGLTAISCRSSLHSICGAFTRFASGKRAQACRALWPPLMLSAEESCLPRNNMQGTRAPCLLNDQLAFNSHRSSPRTPCSLPDLLCNVTQSRIPPPLSLLSTQQHHSTAAVDICRVRLRAPGGLGSRLGTANEGIPDGRPSIAVGQVLAGPAPRSTRQMRRGVCHLGLGSTGHHQPASS